jgi:hypothetical protein
MKSTELLKPILDGGVRSVNFFNGRLLTGEDLTREQAASREWLGRLGRLLGAGVASGLTVSRAAPGKVALVVSPGIAVNGLGRTLQLTETFEVALEPSDDDSAAAAAAAPALGSFGDCEPPETGIYRAGDGIYLLTIAPASGIEGSVPTNGLGNLTPSCATRFLVDAVKLRVISLTNLFSPEEHSDHDRLRNLIAWKCFGPGAASLVTDPSQPASTRLLDALGKKLPACDVPLAVFRWTANGGVIFLDHWSVRRRLAGPPDELVWSPVLGERRRAEAEALMLQFQDQIDEMAEATPELVEAKKYFRYLPPAGVLPLSGTPGHRGFDVATFFTGLKVRDPIFIEGARVESLVRDALRFPPTSLASGEMIWVYHVRENAMKADGLSGARVQPYAIFASGQIPYCGEAVFDIAHWDYASFS